VWGMVAVGVVFRHGVVFTSMCVCLGCGRNLCERFICMLLCQCGAPLCAAHQLMKSAEGVIVATVFFVTLMLIVAV
jgi:hypothetical protein